MYTEYINSGWFYYRFLFKGLIRVEFGLGEDDGNSFTKEAGAPLSFATLSLAPLPFAQNQRKVAEGSENAPKG